MLCELRVSQLGVIEDTSLVLGPGMTALTGETGAGKTLLVEAVELLLGGRADPLLVRPGAAEAVVEGRFVLPAGWPRPGEEGAQFAGALGLAGAPTAGEAEVVLSRAVPRQGRSRAYLDGRMATAGALASLGRSLVDLHGQHEHQSLLSAPAQREALDAFAGADRGRRDRARAEAHRLKEALASAAGGSGALEREAELLRYQLAELDAAGLSDPEEDERLAEEEEALARASDHRAAAGAAHEALAGEGQVGDRLGEVVSLVSGHAPLAALQERLRAVAAELADLAEQARLLVESLEDDPERLAQVRQRRALLRELIRKYAPAPAGSAAPGRPALQGAREGQHQAGTARLHRGSLAEVFAWREAARQRLEELGRLAGVAGRLAEEHARARAELYEAAAELGAARRAAADRLAAAVQDELRQLAMPRARFCVRVGTGASELAEAQSGGAEAGEDWRELSGEDVCFFFAANDGEPLLPLAKVASGGELARAMLALRLALLKAGAKPAEASGPGTLVFDEVDAGVGGEAALAVGRALAELARQYQVLVVTHLPQVAAFATAQVAVTKSERGGRAVARAKEVSGDERLVELSRMLSGQPASKTARLHAEELLATATRQLEGRGPAKVPGGHGSWGSR